MTRPTGQPISNWLWWLPPLIAVALELSLRAFAPHAVYQALYEAGENSVNEIATVVVLVAAVLVGAVHLKQAMSSQRRVWLIMLVLGCIYFAGEEASWGQHWIGWETPAGWSELNDQGETNLHNMSGWLDQKPRLLLELGILIGLITWALCRLGGRKFPLRPWLWPTTACSMAGALAILVRLPERLGDGFDLTLGPLWTIRLAETQELMFAFFLLTFIATLRPDPAETAP